MKVGCCPLSADSPMGWSIYRFNATAPTDTNCTEPVPDGVGEPGLYSHKRTLTFRGGGGGGGGGFHSNFPHMYTHIHTCTLIHTMHTYIQHV